MWACGIEIGFRPTPCLEITSSIFSYEWTMVTGNFSKCGTQVHKISVNTESKVAKFFRTFPAVPGVVTEKNCTMMSKLFFMFE